MPLTSCDALYGTDQDAALVVGTRRVHLDDLRRDMAYVSPGGDSGAFKGREVMEPALHKAIDRYLIIEYAGEHGITVSKAELEDAVGGLAGRYDGDALREALLKEYVTEDQWRARLGEQLLIEKTVETALEALPAPSYGEIQAYYAENRSTFHLPEMVRFRQVVTRTREEAEAILSSLKRGGDMAELARKHSMGPEGEHGGEVGWIARGELDESMENVLFSMPVGKISSVVKSPYGYHVFELLAFRKERARELPEVYREIEAELTARNRTRRLEAWMKELRERYLIQINYEKINKLWAN